MKKNRVKAVVQGKTGDTLYLFWKKTFGYQPSYINFEHVFKCSMTKEQFNAHVKPFLEKEEVKDVSKDHSEFVKMYMRFKGLRNKAKRVYELGDLVFVNTRTNILVYNKDQVFKTDLTTHKWNKKSDKELAKKLTEQNKSLA